MGCIEVETIISGVFIAFTDQMTSLQMHRQNGYIPISEQKYCFEVRTSGSFVSLILFEMETAVFEKIAGTVFPKESLSHWEKKLYVIEYLNIICGRILSQINDSLGQRSALSVPVLTDCDVVAMSDGATVRHSYLCSEGIINIVMNFDIHE